MRNKPMTMTTASPPRRKMIDTMEVAEILGCHPMSVPRFVKVKLGFPQPMKPFNKNIWYEDEVVNYRDKLLAGKAGRAA